MSLERWVLTSMLRREKQRDRRQLVESLERRQRKTVHVQLVGNDGLTSTVVLHLEGTHHLASVLRKRERD